MLGGEQDIETHTSTVCITITAPKVSAVRTLDDLKGIVLDSSGLENAAQESALAVFEDLCKCLNVPPKGPRLPNPKQD